MCSFDAIKKDVKITIKHHGAMPIVEMDRPAYWVQYLYKPEPNTAARSVFLFKAFKYHIQRSKWVWTFTCHRHNNWALYQLSITCQTGQNVIELG